MRGSTWMVTVGAVLAMLAAPAALAQNSQQTKMATCNAEAKTAAPTGEAHKAFMQKCLSAHPAAEPAAKGNSQQDKMKACNAEAKTKAPTGEAHKAFMSDCLKSTGKTP